MSTSDQSVERCSRCYAQLDDKMRCGACARVRVLRFVQTAALSALLVVVIGGWIALFVFELAQRADCEQRGGVLVPAWWPPYACVQRALP